MRQTYATEKLRPNDEWSFIDLSLYPICYRVSSHGEASESLVEQVPIQDSACVVAVCPKICGLIEISDLSVSLLAAILQHLNLTSFKWSYISLDPQI